MKLTASLTAFAASLAATATSLDEFKRTCASNELRRLFSPRGHRKYAALSERRARRKFERHNRRASQRRLRHRV